MKGDFSRSTFRPSKAFSRVLLQQGRVHLDADWNEQVSILLHHLRTLTRDSVGPFARPPAAAGGGFVIDKTANNDPLDFAISFGHCWVNGLLVENRAHAATYRNQPSLRFQQDQELLTLGKSYFVYLDVWERLKTALEDHELREIALGGPDTAARSEIVWQVKVAEVETGPQQGATREEGKTKAEKSKPRLAGGPFPEWKQAFGALPRRARGALKARVTDPDPDNEPCRLPPSAKYRGENQLWRVEVHRGGKIGNEGSLRPTFKVSSDNGSVVYPLAAPAQRTGSSDEDKQLSNYQVELITLGRDARTALAEGDWVELVDDQYALESASDDREPDSLLQVVQITADGRSATLRGGDSTVEVRSAPGQFLRRWDQGNVLTDFIADDPDAYGTFEIVQDELKLASGIRLAFSRLVPPDDADQLYRRGDYWLIPGREVTGDIEWPRDPHGDPIAQPPLGITHHFAPLAVIQNDGGWKFEPLMRELEVELSPVELEEVDEL